MFTDIAGSSKLLQELGAELYAEALGEHRRVVRAAFGARGGVEVDTQGDAFFFAFPTATGALQAAADAREGLAVGPIRVRTGIHTGTPLLTEGGYVGVDVHRAARIAACGHGGQVLVSASTAGLVGVDELRDLGAHRLKDLSALERVYQLGSDGFPPLRSLHQSNLPIQSTSFLGRDSELSTVVGLLGHGGARVLTLTGPGGTGKTRLAIAAAAEVTGRYPQGVWWVSLATLADPTLVLETAARALGSKVGLAEHVGDRSMLLLFDNFEHVIDGATDLAALLAACPNLHLLVTSREPLSISGEHEYRVPTFSHSEAISFFLATARAVRPDFPADDAVSKICRQLDDLPLALELAAARVKVLSSQQLLARLEQRLPLLTGGSRDQPERQRTLRAAIAWSYELLTPSEQRLFARLAVFAGGCTLENAEAVAEATLDDLQSLADKSLVRSGDERFAMLETIREYASERLAEQGELELMRSRHANQFLEIAESMARPLRDEVLRASGESLDRLGREHDNIRAALDRFDSTGDGQRALRLAGAVWPYWRERGHLAEGRRRLDKALDSDATPTTARGSALNGAAMLAVHAGDTVRGRMRGEESVTLHRALDESWGTAESLWSLGYALAEEGDFRRARELFDESARLFDSLGDLQNLVAVTRSLAWAHSQLGDQERACAIHEENLIRARALGNRHYEAITLGALAMIAVSQGQLDTALGLLRQNVPIYADLGDPFQTSVNLCRVAHALSAASRSTTTAALLISCSAAYFEKVGAKVPWVVRMNDESLVALHGRLDDATFTDSWTRGQALTVDEAVAFAVGALK